MLVCGRVQGLSGNKGARRPEPHGGRTRSDGQRGSVLCQRPTPLWSICRWCVARRGDRCTAHGHCLPMRQSPPGRDRSLRTPIRSTRRRSLPASPRRCRACLCLWNLPGTAGSRRRRDASCGRSVPPRRHRRCSGAPSAVLVTLSLLGIQKKMSLGIRSVTACTLAALPHCRRGSGGPSSCSPTRVPGSAWACLSSSLAPRSRRPWALPRDAPCCPRIFRS